jgi:hypothetical protein
VNQDLTPEDHALLSALPARPPAPLEEETLTRLYHETLGLVSFGLAPIPPRPSTKRRLMAAITAATPANLDRAEPDAPPPPPLPFLRPGTAPPPATDVAATPKLVKEVAPVPAAPPGLELEMPVSAPDDDEIVPERTNPRELLEAPEPPAHAEIPTPPEIDVTSPAISPLAPPAILADHRPTGRAPRAAGADRRSSRSGRSNRQLGLAAALILSLAGTSGWLYRDLSAQRQAGVRLADERDAAARRAAELEGQLNSLTAEVRNMRDHAAVVTSPAVEACSLQPMAPGMAEIPGMAAAHGVLFVAADHQHWYMSVRGLPAPGAGKVYQLWFIGDHGPESGGTFSPADADPRRAGRPSSAWDLSAEHMPLGTKEVRITVETGTGSVQPQGPEAFRNAAFRVL